MTKPLEENLILKEIFGTDVKINYLKLGDLVYLVDSLDRRVLSQITKATISNFVNPKFAQIAVKDGYRWRDIIDKTKVMDMPAEEALYLDYLARLNEIHKKIYHIVS